MEGDQLCQIEKKKAGDLPAHVLPVFHDEMRENVKEHTPECYLTNEQDPPKPDEDFQFPKQLERDVSKPRQSGFLLEFVTAKSNEHFVLPMCVGYIVT